MDETSAHTLYGKGVFTTISIRNGQPYLWEKHWRRLSDNAAKLEIDISNFSEAETLKALHAKLNGRSDGRARISFLDGSTSAIWPMESPGQTRLDIIVGVPRIVPKNLTLTVSPHRVNTTSPLIGIKSCNYLEHLLAYEEARSRGYHEAIRINERGEVVSGCMSNIFWRTNGKLYTPRLTTGCLAGTTREHLLESVGCEEVTAGIAELESAESIFMTSAGLGVVSVAEFNGRSLATSTIEF